MEERRVGAISGSGPACGKEVILLQSKLRGFYWRGSGTKGKSQVKALREFCVSAIIGLLRVAIGRGYCVLGGRGRLLIHFGRSGVSSE